MSDVAAGPRRVLGPLSVFFFSVVLAGAAGGALFGLSSCGPSGDGDADAGDDPLECDTTLKPPWQSKDDWCAGFELQCSDGIDNDDDSGDSLCTVTPGTRSRRCGGSRPHALVGSGSRRSSELPVVSRT